MNVLMLENTATEGTSSAELYCTIGALKGEKRWVNLHSIEHSCRAFLCYECTIWFGCVAERVSGHCSVDTTFSKLTIKVYML